MIKQINGNTQHNECIMSDTKIKDKIDLFFDVIGVMFFAVHIYF